MENNRTIVITDIHGELGKLNSLLNNLQIRKSDEFIFMGDYIDRGENSKGVIDRVIELGKSHKCIYLKGSHEYAFLHSLKNEDYYKFLFWTYGGVQTAESYGGYENIYPTHKNFFDNLLPYYATDKYFFVHAGIRPNIPLDKQDEKDFYYIREEFYNYPHSLPQKIIFGHTDFPKVLIRDDKIGLDTGCGKYPNAVLTALILENGGESFVTSKSAC